MAAATVLVALVATSEAGVPLRDPNGVSLRRFLIAVGLVAVLIVVDVAFRGARRERWTPARLGVVALAVVSFYVTYLAYRNLKSVVPLLRTDVLFDGDLADLERSVFAGSDPASLLHSLLGTGLAAHGLSFVYDLFFLSSRCRSRSRSSSCPTCGPASSTSRRCRSTGRWPPAATSCCRRSDRSTLSRPTSPLSPTPP